MPNAIDNALKFHQTVLDLRARRQELIASNIANGDTPHFKAQDIDFRQALAQATAGRTAGTPGLTRTSVRHLAAEGMGPHNAALLYRTELQSSVDGNTVNMDVERAQFAENAIHYEASLTFINGMLRTMQLAIQGQ